MAAETELPVAEEDRSAPLSRLLWLDTSLLPPPLCSGLGRCGTCRVRFLSTAPQLVPAERTVLSDRDLALGYRLACRHNYEECEDASGCVLLDIPRADRVVGPGRVRDARHGILAVDLGTTSLCWTYVVAAALNESCEHGASGRMLNPQIGAGSEVVSRLQLARDPKMRARLSRCVQTSLQAILATTPACEGLVVCANTAMTDIFLDRDISGLCAAPYVLTHKGNCTVAVGDLPPIYIPPLIAPFLGSDCACAVWALLRRGLPRPWLMVDLGTNAEFALRTVEGRLFMTSIPMGPALEGIGMRCGHVAEDNVITRFTHDVSGLRDSRIGMGQGDALGISATGYFSLLALLRSLGILTESGVFVRSHPMPYAQKILRTLRTEPSIELPLPGNVCLAAEDIEACLVVKASFSCACTMLLQAAGMRAEELAAIYLAGALGEHCRADDLRTLGFFPNRATPVVALGNAALEGACDLACHPEHAEELADLCGRSECLSLADDPNFQRLFVESMHF